MKIINFFILVAAFPLRIASCPTCVGKIKTDSPPFFSDDVYQPGKALHEPITSAIAHEKIKKLSELKKEKK